MDLSRFALYPHQVAGVEFLARRGRAILGDDMGLGKTRQAIIALRESAPTGVFLVICPASLKLNWARESAQVRRPWAQTDPEGVIGVFIERLMGTPALVKPALGLGADVRLGGRDLVGAPLVNDGEVVYLSAFPRAARPHRVIA